MENAKSKNKIQERTYDFSLRIIKLVQALPQNNAGFVLGKQLLRSGTSIGANVEEAIGAFSKEDFTYKMSIALKEARETNYWLRLIKDAELLNTDLLGPIIEESVEIRKILTAIVKTSKGR